MKQRGFTLVELLVALAILGIIVPVIVSTIFGVTRGTAQNNGTAVALADVDRAAHFLTRDLGMAQATTLIDGAPLVSQVTLTWNDMTKWAVNEALVSHTVTYALSGTSLQRDYDGQVTTVGRYLTRAEFSLAGRFITVTLTSSPADYIPRPSETRGYRIYLRAEP